MSFAVHLPAAAFGALAGVSALAAVLLSIQPAD
jgi:hypothetical protein